ncbi:MAG TPA: peptidoglycan-associated lipoprotein, partial [Burkholderiales bacterium]|nr:peptidoglycan-associated lipoprotein [Burkholderiales bacterium]
RADGVRKALALLGVADSRIETVSWGEEKPRATGHDEAAWAQNRRSDIVYTHE